MTIHNAPYVPVHAYVCATGRMSATARVVSAWEAAATACPLSSASTGRLPGLRMDRRAPPGFLNPAFAQVKISFGLLCTSCSAGQHSLRYFLGEITLKKIEEAVEDQGNGQYLMVIGRVNATVVCM